MPKTYVTFGQSHEHNIDGKIFDKNCVAAIEAETAAQGREKAFELFNAKFCFEYFDKEFDMKNLHFFPRGIINVT